MVEGTVMVKDAGKRSAARYGAFIFAAFVAAFIVGLAVAYLSVWIMGVARSLLRLRSWVCFGSMGGVLAPLQ
jgi:hypothetical protein